MAFLIFFIFNLFLSATPLLAQSNTNPNQYKNNVSYQQDLYNQAYNFYLEKKQVNTQYNSIATEKELIDSIKTTLIHREELLSTYLLYLRSAMEEYKPISANTTNNLQQTLFEHQVWLKNQSKQIALIQNKEQLDQYNQSFDQRYIQIQISIDKSRVQNHINHQQTIIKRIKNFILSLKAEQSLDQQAQDWINQIEQDLQTCQQHLELADKETQIKQYGKSFNEFYKDSLDEINKSKSILTKTVSDLQSLIKKFS